MNSSLKRKAPGKIKITVSIAVVMTVVVMAWGTYTLVTWKGDALTPNELGDFLAGFASTLAFLWIIVTIVVQGEELRLQNEQTILIAKESAAQSAALSASAKTYFSERWERALIRFEYAWRRAFNRIGKELVNEMLSPAAVTQRIRESHKDPHGRMSEGVVRISEADHQGFRAENDVVFARVYGRVVHAFTNGGHEEHRFTIDGALGQEKVFDKLLSSGIQMDYLRQLVREALQMGLETMIRDSRPDFVKETPEEKSSRVYGLPSNDPTASSVSLTSFVVQVLVSQERPVSA